LTAAKKAAAVAAAKELVPVVTAKMAATVVLLVAAGCSGAMGGGGGGEVGGEAGAPAWVKKISWTDGAKRYYVGQAVSVATAEDARGLAMQDAMRRMANEAGVTIAEESTYQQQEADGSYSYDVDMLVTSRSMPLRVGGMKIEGEHRREAEVGEGFDAWVMLSVPQVELDKAIRAAKGLLLLVFSCETDVLPACPSASEERVRGALTDAGLSLVTDELEWSADTAGLAAAAATKGAAMLVLVELEARFEEEVNEEYYSYGRGVAQVVDTGDGQTIAAVDTGEVKGGHYSKADSVRDALRKASGDLGAALSEKLAP